MIKVEHEKITLVVAPRLASTGNIHIHQFFVLPVLPVDPSTDYIRGLRETNAKIVLLYAKLEPSPLFILNTLLRWGLA